MSYYNMIKIWEHPEWGRRAADWFHQKWDIPAEEYQKSIEECRKAENPVPQWYLAVAEDEIIGGLGVIENDFHNRKDLAPNLCALYVEEKYRCKGIAGELLEYVCNDMKAKGIGTLYLVTDHTSFYERYGWEFLCMVQEEGEEAFIRMYVHREA